jgi:hypothetical protein
MMTTDGWTDHSRCAVTAVCVFVGHVRPPKPCPCFFLPETVHAKRCRYAPACKRDSRELACQRIAETGGTVADALRLLWISL